MLKFCVSSFLLLLFFHVGLCWRDVYPAPLIIFCDTGVNFDMQNLAKIVQIHANYMEFSVKKKILKFLNGWSWRDGREHISRQLLVLQQCMYDF